MGMVCTERAILVIMVRKERLELSRLAALEPKSSASTNFATSAKNKRCWRLPPIPRARIVALASTTFNAAGHKTVIFFKGYGLGAQH